VERVDFVGEFVIDEGFADGQIEALEELNYGFTFVPP
jgi:hypothetical protein